MNDGHHPPGLWFVPGDAVLARAGGCILLSSAAKHDFLEALLEGLANAADGSHDFARLAEDALGSDAAWQAGEPLPAVVAIGPSPAGMTVTVSGTAWAEITTAHGVQRLEAGQPSLLLRCVLRSGVLAAHGGVDAERGRARTDRFSRLDAGTVRAGGFTYHPGARQDPVPARDEPDAARTGSSDTGAARPAPATAPPAAGDQPFEAVLLISDLAEEIDARPALPLLSSDLDGKPAANAPIIPGVYCKNDHFDDPAARFCAVCGISMNQLTLVPRPGHRPPLGMLVLDDGAVFQLDHDYVIGRDPALDASVAVGTARPLHTSDDAGTVSRVHARIDLDGWLVLVTDLGSTNGTRIRLPGQAADQLLAPRVPTAILPGSRIDLGARRIRYESHRGR